MILAWIIGCLVIGACFALGPWYAVISYDACDTLFQLSPNICIKTWNYAQEQAAVRASGDDSLCTASITGGSLLGLL
ncbi:hypothetical protein MKX03_017599 [Papaver bracteatum]|nr:hypothetical protein MKX03_017599 [Papaver bracteatum]